MTITLCFILLLAALYALRVLFFLDYRQRLVQRIDLYNAVEIVQTQDSTDSMQRWAVYDQLCSNILPVVLLFWRPFRSHYTGSVLEPLA